MSERQLYRFGAVCAIVGGVLALVFNLLHPRLEDYADPVAEHLRIAAESGSWVLIHLGITVGALLLIAALYVVARSLADDAGGYRLGRLALGSLVISAPVGLITLAIDGYATKFVADAWSIAANQGGEGVSLVAGAAVNAIGWAVFMFFILLLLGLTPLLYGAAIAASDDYPAAVGWVGVVLGAASIVVGLIGFFDGPSELFFTVFTVTSGLGTLWVVALGVLLWRRAGTTEDRLAATANP